MELTWDELADFCGVTRSMIFFYLDEKNSIPNTLVERICRKLSNQTRLPDSRYYELDFSRGRKYVPKIPSVLDENLAELIGILLGDGHLGPTNYEISVTGDRITDNWYVKIYVSHLIKFLFDINPTIYEQSHPQGIRCKFYSAKVFRFLTNTLGMQARRKRYNENVTIPQTICNDDKLLRSCLLGLFDTDGGFYRHHEHGATMEVCHHNVSLLTSIQNAFGNLGFHVSCNQSGIRLYRRDQIDEFFKLIGSHNPKHLIKYKTWKSTEVVPSSREISHWFVVHGLTSKNHA